MQLSLHSQVLLFAYPTYWLALWASTARAHNAVIASEVCGVGILVRRFPFLPGDKSPSIALGFWRRKSSCKDDTSTSQLEEEELLARWRAKSLSFLFGIKIALVCPTTEHETSLLAKFNANWANCHPFLYIRSNSPLSSTACSHYTL